MNLILKKIYGISILMLIYCFQSLKNDFEILADGYRQQGKEMQAAEYYNKAGYAYWNKGDKERAAQAFEKAYEIFEHAKNNSSCLILSNNLGLIYTEIGNYHRAENVFQKSLQIARQLKNKTEIFNAHINLANVSIDLGNYEVAIQHANEALNIAKEQNNLKNIAKCYSLLAESNEKLGNTKGALQYFELYSAADKKIKQHEMEMLQNLTSEEINKAHIARQVAEIELKIKKGELKLTQDSLQVTEKIALQRKMEISQKTAQLEQKELQLRYERNIRRLVSISLLFVLIFLVILSIMLIRIKKQKEEILRQRNELNIKNKNITDSIFYGQRIQNAMLPDFSTFQDDFEASVIYYPKDIVSGDFYWYLKVQYHYLNYHFFAVVDCTGHGVPGAFMSMIGNRLLNEIVGVRNKIDPSEILYHLNQLLINELHQTGTHTIDGMDIALLRLLKLENQQYEMVFAGAKRPLIVYQHKDRECRVIEGNLIAIGNLRHKSYKSYSEHHLILQSNDVIIAFSDGITDQPNSQRSKFGTSRLINIANETLGSSLEKFMVHIQNSIESFRENEPQRDDITLLGIRLK